MPDLDDRFDELRSELHEAVAVPELDRVVARARQRTSRRRTQIAAAVAVLVVSAVVPGMRVLDAGVPPATTTSTTAPTTMTTRPTQAPWSDELIWATRFADTRNGYALRADCEGDGRTAPLCTVTLLATQDGDRWVAVGPVPSGPLPMIADLQVLGPREVAVQWTATPATAGSLDLRLHSEDGGRTWQRVPTAVTGEVASIPAGSELRGVCEYPRTCSAAGFEVVRPGSAGAARLTGDPGLLDSMPGRVPMANGDWWVAGRKPGSGRWAIAVSHDHGRTWTTRELDWAGTAFSWAVVSAGDTLYAAVSASTDGDSGLGALFRSEDGGRSWTTRWDSADGGHVAPFTGAPVVSPDGTLTLTEVGTDEAHVSTDGGRTLVKVHSERRGPVAWTRGGYLAWGAGEFEMSEDGEHWRTLDIPLE